MKAKTWDLEGKFSPIIKNQRAGVLIMDDDKNNDYISIDEYELIDCDFKALKSPKIEIYIGGEVIFSGSKEELKNKLTNK